jgi:hypothetical protein
MASHVLHWNGKDLPEELRKLRPGRYVVEDADEAPELSAEEEADVERALDEIDRGEAEGWASWEDVSTELDALAKP